MNIMTQHTYLPATLISDKGTAFMFHVIKDEAGVLGITLKHATKKHARTVETVGLLEQSHASIKQETKIETGERMSLWHKYVNIAVLNYNTSYQNWESLRSNSPFLLRKLPKMFLIKQKRSIELFAKMPCKLTSNTKILTTKKPTLQSSKKQIMCTSYSRKRIIKGVKFHLQKFSGLARTLLKRC